MTDRDLVVITKILHIALGYGSREERIRAMIDSRDLDVGLLANSLRYRGLLLPTGTKIKPADLRDGQGGNQP
jgi:hypothetical protein